MQSDKRHIILAGPEVAAYAVVLGTPLVSVIVAWISRLSVREIRIETSSGAAITVKGGVVPSEEQIRAIRRALEEPVSD